MCVRRRGRSSLCTVDRGVRAARHHRVHTSLHVTGSATPRAFRERRQAGPPRSQVANMAAAGGRARALPAAGACGGEPAGVRRRAPDARRAARDDRGPTHNPTNILNTPTRFRTVHLRTGETGNGQRDIRNAHTHRDEQRRPERSSLSALASHIKGHREPPPPLTATASSP